MAIRTVLSILEKGHEKTMLELFSDYSHFQQLVATMLSSRTKDSTTIPLVRKLFQEYPTAEDLVKVNLKELEKSLFGIGFYKVKARHLKALSKQIINTYKNDVPRTFEELVSLPGVGRKTANCILASTFHQPAIAVDVHVHRISNRLGWVNTIHPEETELGLKEIVPRELWRKINPLLVDHGQRVCLPLRPKCKTCTINKYCLFGKNYS